MFVIDPKVDKPIEIRYDGELLGTITAFHRQGKRRISLGFDLIDNVILNNTAQKARNESKNEQRKQD